MSIQRLRHQISHVVIYKGHEQNPFFGPYPANIIKRIAMFEHLNQYRERHWKVTSVAGEHLVEALKKENPEETLLVIPAGQSTRLDKAFTLDQTNFIKDEFLFKGGRGYFNCGSAYWVSAKRVYKDLCEEQPVNPKSIVKTTTFPLFEGVAEGPLCPYPGKKYQVGFFSDAVRVTGGNQECSIFLSGGGSFILPEEENKTQKTVVLVKYQHAELQRHGKTAEECHRWENAVVMTQVGKGAALLSMFHPYYGPTDIDTETYEKAFPDCGTNWREVKEKLSPLDIRMQFVMQSMLSPLENMHF